MRVYECVIMILNEAKKYRMLALSLKLEYMQFPWEMSETPLLTVL